MFVYRYCACVLKMTSRFVRYIYEFILGNKHKVLESKAYGCLGTKPPATGGNRASGGRSSSVWRLL